MLGFLLASVAILALFDLNDNENHQEPPKNNFDGDDTIEGSETGTEEIHLDTGDDLYNVHGGDHTVYGGRGNDTYTFEDDKITEQVKGVFWGSSGNDTMTVDTDSDSTVTLYGGSGNDVFIETGNHHTRMYGGRGDDSFDVVDAEYVDGGRGYDHFNLYVGQDKGPDDVPTIVFNKASDSINIELEGFTPDIVSYILNQDETGVLGTTVKVGDTPIVYLLNETGLLEDAVTKQTSSINLTFM